MAAPSVIVAPTPTVVQGHPIAETVAPGTDTSPGIEQVQAAFDKVFPVIKTSPTPPEPVAKETPEVVTQPEQREPAEPVQPAETVTSEQPAKEPDHVIPSFLEEALKAEPSTAPAQPAVEDEWPEELPTFKTPEESKNRYRAWREQYNGLKKELASARSQPAQDPALKQQNEMLQRQNAQMAEHLNRLGVQHSAEFQQQVMAPLTAHWNEAARIVRDAGGDPQALAKAMSLNGKAQFEALDEIFSEMPESAKTEAHDALRNYRRFEEVRRRAVADAPKTMEALRARENERMIHEVNKQREGMQSLFNNALKTLRDTAKVEVFQRSTNPKDKWWNDQAEALEAQARHLYMENTDMDKVAMACLLAPTADAYRKMFIGSQKQVQKLQKIINDRLGGEPNLSESGGQMGTLPPDRQVQEDLKKPFGEVFLREFHRAQQRSR